MAEYLAKRLVLAIVTTFGVSVGVFLMIHLAPGDPVLVMLSDSASPGDITAMRRELGLDRPLYVQYARYVGHAVTGDLGRSIRSNRSVVSEVMSRLPNTAKLTAAALVLATAVGGTVGILSAVRPRSVLAYSSTLAVLVGLALPSFWLGLMLIILFSLRLGWFPVAGYTGWDALVLPAVTLAATPTAFIARLTRNSLREVLDQDHIRTARAKGLSGRAVVLRHALKASLIPVITIIGLQFGYLLGGAVITENVFAWPGVGRLVVDAILARDFPVVQGVVLFVALGFVLINLMVDLSYGYLDPRIRFR